MKVLEKGGRALSDASEVVVYVEGPKTDTVSSSSPKPRPARAVMRMKGKSFTPHVVVLPVGGTVEFPNEDPIFHNVFSVSGDNRFDLELYRRPKSGSWTFQKPGVVRVYCNIHPQMSAVVVVRDNPYFARANADGTFSIEGVPPGRHTIAAWHERGGEAASDVVVPPEGAVAVRLTLDASSFKKVSHKNKFGKDYDTTEKY